MPSSARRRTPARILLILSLVAAALVTTALDPRTGITPVSQAAATTPTGALALVGGFGATIDGRTGQVSTSVPLTTVGGQGAAAVTIDLSWAQERAAAGVDRSGWGAGWSMGNSFVDVAGRKRVYPADGGAYFLDPTEPSGLQNYKLRDLTFTSKTGILPRRSGAGQVSFSYELAYPDGRADYFDVNGNLAARIDRFGNRVDLTWRPRANNVWQPTSVIDVFGLATTFDYSTSDVVKVVSPRRADGVVSTTTVAINSSQGVQSVTDPVGSRATFSYTSVIGAPKPLLTGIIAATGSRTRIGYQSPSYQPALVVASTLSLTDATGNPLSPVQSFDPNPLGGSDRRNFTGYPNHLGTAGQDALFASGDTAYTYTTAMRTGATTTRSTYDALHRMVGRTISVVPAPGKAAVTTQTQQVSYSTPVRIPQLLTPNFAHPTQVKLTESSATSVAGIVASAPRITTTSTEYDDHGRVLSATDEVGTTTTTDYDDRYGVVTAQTTTGADGTVARQVNTLTDDGSNIETSAILVGTKGGKLSARQQLSYVYDEGQLTRRTLTWAPGAKPDPDEPGGGPDQIVTTFTRSAPDVADRTQQLTTTIAAGTDAAEATTATLDLVSGRAVDYTDAMGRVTTFEYDARGRRTKLTTPGGLVTSTAYTPTQTTVTNPDGRVVRTTVDLLGRPLSVTDNVKGGALVADPTARTLSAHSYSPDGTSTTVTGRTGATMVARLDAFGRTVSRRGPTGLTHLTSFDDGRAHNSVAALAPEGATQPVMSTTTTRDDADRVTGSRTDYGLGAGNPLSDPARAKTFDGIGQPVSATQGDLTVATDFSGPGGIPASSTATPQETDDFPGEPMTAITTRSLTGAATSRTLHQGDQVSPATSVVYDAAGNIVSAVDAEGRETRYTYTPDGRPETKTDPSGAVTTSTYDPTLGFLSGVTVTAPGLPTRTITYTRVPSGQPGVGQVKTVSDGTDTITYGYDVDGHRTSVSYPDGTSTSADYDDTGQLATTTDVTGAVTSYVYDPDDGTMTSATQRRGDAVLASVVFAYDELSRVDTLTRGNGTVTKNSYTSQNQLATQTTTDSGGRVLEAHAYTYDAHYNPATRSDTYAPGGSASAAGGTWTTIYSYDAYNRLTGSAVYSGALVNGKPIGVPATTAGYTIDVGGDVTATKRTTRIPGPRPITTTATVTNTIDDSGRLTGQRTGSTTLSQSFDDDGRVLKSLTGTVTTYLTDGSPGTTALPDGTTTAYGLWPDGSRRSATTTRPDGSTTSISYHYGVAGELVNDSTVDASTGAGAAGTASYLLTTGREARTLLAGTRPSGAVVGTPAAPIDTGTGVGYYLRDRHSSVSGLVDDTGKVTATYAYSDYGSPVRADGRSVSLGGYDGGRTNPYTYLGAAATGPTTDRDSGLLTFDHRTYNPSSGRFTSPDPVDAHNRYQAFVANPIVYADLSGGVSTTDIIFEAVFAALMVVTAVLTGGATVAAWAAVETSVAVTAGLAANLLASAVGTVANVVGGVAGAVLTVNDTLAATSDNHKGFLSDQQRDGVNLLFSAATAAAGVTGIVQGLTEGAVAAAKAATTVTTEVEVVPASTELVNEAPNARDNVIPPGGGDQNDVGGNPPVNADNANPAANANPEVNANANANANNPGDGNPMVNNQERVNEEIIEGADQGGNNPEQPVPAVQVPAAQPVVPDVIPGPQNQADATVLRLNPEIPAALNVAEPLGNGVEHAVEPPVDTLDEISADADETSSDESDYDSDSDSDLGDFDNANVILLKRGYDRYDVVYDLFG